MRDRSTQPTVDNPAFRESPTGGEPLEPRRAGRFVLLERLGAGGMGVVYAAYDERLARRVAIKVVRPRPGDEHRRSQESLVREAQALARLTHPNVVPVYEVGTLPDGDVFVAMEFVPGQSLGQFSDQQRDHWRRVLAVYVQAGAGLAAAHRATPSGRSPSTARAYRTLGPIWSERAQTIERWLETTDR